VRLHRARARFARELAQQGVQRPAGAGQDTAGWAATQSNPQEAQ
jgi:hypothetical protein